MGEFNNWDGRYHPMRTLGASGVWELFVPGLGEGTLYKFEVKNAQGIPVLKTDPFGFLFESAPKTASVVWNNTKFQWTDEKWMAARAKRNPLRSAMSIYEVHLGSWRKKNHFESLSYRDLAGPLVEYLNQTGFTHVEFLPVAEHAFYPSWGYQVTGFFGVTNRFGTPDDFQFLVNALHEGGIGVIIDWVPAHFPRDEWALAHFDGTALYEHEDPRKGAHQDWGTLIFNFGRQRGLGTSSSLKRALSGASASTSTACAWTPWPRCSTSTTRARPASGFPTNTAAARILRPSSSSRNSTTLSTPSILA